MTRTRLYEPPRIEPQVWEPDFPSPVSPPPRTPQSPVPPAQTPQSPVPPAQTPQSPVPPGQSPVPASSGQPPRGGRSSLRRSLFAVLAALVLVAVVVGGVLAIQELNQDDASAAPEIDLAPSWSEEGEQVGESTWSYPSDDGSLELLVNTATSSEGVQDEAKADMKLQRKDGYTREVSRELTAEDDLGDWQVGWDLEYAEGDDYHWRWYFGNANPETAGWVELNGPKDALMGDAERKEQSMKLLRAARDAAILGKA